MTFNDKHQQEQEGQEFSRTSNQWIIHPKYDQAAGNNYDLCLVKLERPIDLITGISLKWTLLHVGDRCLRPYMYVDDKAETVTNKHNIWSPT